MDLLDRGDAFRIGGEAQIKRADQIAAQREKHPEKEQRNFERTSLEREIADEERGHHRGLQAANAAARFVYSDGPVRKLDQAAGLMRRDADEVQDFDICRCDLLLE